MPAVVEELRDAIATLASIDRPSASPGERQGAELIAERLRAAGADVRVEPEQVHGTYWWPLGLTSVAGIAASALARRGHRLAAAALGVAASASVVDDLDVGRRWLRRALPRRLTANVVAEAGDRKAAHTVVMVSHHDAAHTGTFFNPRLTEAIAELLGGDDSDEAPTQIPVMAPIAVAPAVIALGALLRSPRLARLGVLACWGIIASFTEIALRATVPGANDNLSGVATLIGVARMLQEKPVEGVRVIFVSTGAEESLMEGMEAFARRHFTELPTDRTTFLCVDTVGSPRLILAESEGMMRVRTYDEGLKDLVASTAADCGVKITRGWQMKLGTDGYVALRHGYPAAMIMSIDRYGAPSNYHWRTDTADRVDYARVADTVALCDAVIRRIAAG
ncbi:MAG TPA: M28 family peptidase [Acidimicrobiales bacterium]|nr:M28 family peptidase [Acidimicrobiales bacterium]